MKIFGKVIDERFLNHRLRSTSLAGIVGGVFASVFFMYRFYISHIWSWDLLSVALVIVLVKFIALAWYRLSD